MKIIQDKTVSSADAIFIFLPRGSQKKDLPEVLSDDCKKMILAHFRAKNFEGKTGEILQIFQKIKNTKKSFLVGLGNCKTQLQIRKAGGVAIRKAGKIKSKKVVFLANESTDPKPLVSGAILGNYKFKITNKSQKNTLEILNIVGCQNESKKLLDSEISCAKSTNFVRDLVNFPANFMTPKILAEKAKKIGNGVRNPIKIKVLGEKDMQKIGMGSLLGVGQGSHEESQLIVLEYRGGAKSDAPTAIVGKAVCFDSGGYNLKPTKSIEAMKQDMAGGATVIGIFRWISEIRPPCNIVGVVGAVENLVSGNALKPGDILTAMDGKTIEITNTDAEGRLVLADCLNFVAKKYNPARILDVATLTGAAIVALGNKITPIMGNNRKLIEKVKKSAILSDESVWELPITDYFREKIKGEISDLQNWTDGVNAGSSMGGAFLESFVDGIPWVHFDIGGTAFVSDGDDVLQKGATGVMMRTLKCFFEKN